MNCYQHSLLHPFLSPELLSLSLTLNQTLFLSLKHSWGLCLLICFFIELVLGVLI